MPRFSVDLTHPDDPHNRVSFSSGRHGYDLAAADIDDAAARVVDTAMADGYYGYDWEAMICPLSQAGRRDRLAAAFVALY
jgi:hypothetical protein